MTLLLAVWSSSPTAQERDGSCAKNKVFSVEKVLRTVFSCFVQFIGSEGDACTTDVKTELMTSLLRDRN